MAENVFEGDSEEIREILPPICHESIPDFLLSRIEKVYRQIAALVEVQTLEQWEVSFMRTTNLEVGISNWEVLVETLNECYKTQTLYQKTDNGQKLLDGKKKKQVIFNILAFYLANALTKSQLEEKWISTIVSIFENRIKK